MESRKQRRVCVCVCEHREVAENEDSGQVHF